MSCDYIFSRGDRAGKRCDKNPTGGKKKCSSHAKISDAKISGAKTSPPAKSSKVSKTEVKNESGEVARENEAKNDDVAGEDGICKSLTTKKIRCSKPAKIGNLCSIHYKLSGKKDEDLIEITETLGSMSVSSSSLEEPKKKVEKKVEPKKKAAAKPKEVVKSKPPMVFEPKTRKILSMVENKFGRLQHDESDLLFDAANYVYGVQLIDGSVGELTLDHIEKCKKYNLRFHIRVEELKSQHDDEKDSNLESLYEEEDDEENSSDAEVDI